MKIAPFLSAVSAAVLSAIGVTVVARALVPHQEFPPAAPQAQSQVRAEAADSGCWGVAVRNGKVRADWQAPCAGALAPMPYEGLLGDGAVLRLPLRGSAGPAALRGNGAELSAALVDGYDAGALLWIPAPAQFGYIIAVGKRGNDYHVKVERWGVMPERMRLGNGVIYSDESVRPKRGMSAGLLAPPLHVLEPPPRSTSDADVIDVPVTAPVITVDVAGPAVAPPAGGANSAPRARELSD